MPVGLTPSAGANRVYLSWIPSRDPNVAAYRVYRSASSSQDLVGTVTQPIFLDSSVLTAGAAYYQVAAVEGANQQGEFSSMVRGAYSTSAAPDPTAVTNLTGVTGNNSVFISFSDSMLTNVAFKLRRAVAASGPFYNVIGGQGLLGATSYKDLTAINGQSYWYRLIPINRDGVEGDSQTIGPFTPVNGPPPAPTDLTADVDRTRVTLEWNPAPKNSSTTIF